jgi:hypothetical protein
LFIIGVCVEKGMTFFSGGWDLEVVGRGGYIVLPPSLEILQHPQAPPLHVRIRVQPPNRTETPV